MRTLLLFCSLLLAASMGAQTRSQTVITDNPFTHIDGQEHTLTEIFQQHQGKVIYLDFWASWCGPCRREMPASKAVHEKLKDQDVVFVYISIDEKRPDWTKSVAALGIGETGENYHRAGSKMKDFLNFFQLRSIPRYMIVDKTGQLYESNAEPPSFPSLEKTLRKLANAKTKTKEAAKG